MRSRRASRCVRAAVLSLLLATPARAQDVFERARERAEAGEFAAALEVARSATDRLEGAQAEVWVMFRARDFAACLAAVERGLAAAPDDPWLLERGSACALRLRDPELARAWADRLASADPEGIEVEARVAEAERLVSARTARDRALVRARWTATGLLALAGIAMAAFARRSP